MISEPKVVDVLDKCAKAACASCRVEFRLDDNAARDDV